MGRKLFFFFSWKAVIRATWCLILPFTCTGVYFLEIPGHLHPTCLCICMLSCPEHCFISALPKEAML